LWCKLLWQHVHQADSLVGVVVDIGLLDVDLAVGAEPEARAVHEVRQAVVQQGLNLKPLEMDAVVGDPICRDAVELLAATHRVVEATTTNGASASDALHEGLDDRRALGGEVFDAHARRPHQAPERTGLGGRSLLVS